MSGSFYRAFEDRYRGSRELIKARLQIYLPFLEALAAAALQGGADAAPLRALDLGCGRGEWLELLGEAGFAARGVDLDEGMLAACRERGLDVINGDAIGALRDAPDASLTVVSAFHLVEHISFEQVQELIVQAQRALGPGGLLILETPNPENLVVGTSSFYDDPSHLRPLPPKLLAFAVEFGGFASHGVLRLQEDARLHGQAPPHLFDVLAGASPDYSVLGQKSGPVDMTVRFDELLAQQRGLDLHALAERYQQHQNGLEARLAQASDGMLGLIEQHDYHAHVVDVRFGALEATLVQLRETIDASTRINALEAGLGQLQASSLSLKDNLAHVEEARHAIAERIEQVEATMVVQTAYTSTRLRTRIAELERIQQASESESARLSEHVAWIEGRLTHAESEAGTLRLQLAEMQQKRAPLLFRLMRLPGRLRRRAGATWVGQRLRRRGSALLQQAVRLVLRSPALKRTARTLVARFPGLRVRLLRLLYTPTPGTSGAEAPSDPLTGQMSPRSLAIYRELTRTTDNNKD